MLIIFIINNNFINKTMIRNSRPLGVSGILLNQLVTHGLTSTSDICQKLTNWWCLLNNKILSLLLLQRKTQQQGGAACLLCLITFSFVYHLHCKQQHYQNRSCMTNGFEIKKMFICIGWSLLVVFCDSADNIIPSTRCQCHVLGRWYSRGIQFV